MSHNTASAATYNSWFNIEHISRSNLSDTWTTYNVANAGSYAITGATRLESYRISASAYLDNAVSGGYFNLAGDIFIDIPSGLTGGLSCSFINEAKIVPNTTYNITSTNLTSCTESTPNPYYRRYTLHIATNGTISSGSPDAIHFTLQSSTSNPFISLVGTPNDTPRVFISADISGNVSNSPELQSLQEVNQNLVIVNQGLDNLSNQLEDSTEAIIKSNQHCRQSVNLFTGNFSQFNSTGGSGSTYAYFKLPDDGVYTLTLISKNYVVGSSSTFIGFSSTGGSSTGGTIWAFNNNSSASSKGVKFSVSNSGKQYVSMYAPSTNTLAWFVNNFDIMLEKSSSFTSYEPYGEEVCKSIDEEYYDEQRQADENISNQSTSDISNAENSQTTSLIGVITSFVSAISSVQTGSCELTLPFPNYLGGDTVVNPCTGKDKAPAIISIASSMLLITIFVPLAFIVLKMIYNEIRSFTNG